MIWRGEVSRVDLGQPLGHAPAFTRPGGVVSNDIVNTGLGERVVVVAISSAEHGLRSYVEIAPGVSGVDHRASARCDQVRVILTPGP